MQQSQTYFFTQTVNINRVENCMHNKYHGLSGNLSRWIVTVVIHLKRKHLVTAYENLTRFFYLFRRAYAARVRRSNEFLS